MTHHSLDAEANARIDALLCENDELKAKLREVESQATVMREALLTIQGTCPSNCDVHSECGEIQKAIQFDAGLSLLAEVEALEKVVEALRIVADWDVSEVAPMVKGIARKALSALDEVRKSK